MQRSVQTLVVAVLLPAACPCEGAEPALRWGAMTVVAEGGGVRGPWRQNDSRYDYVDDGAVAFDASGTALVAWVDQRRKEVLFQKFAGGRRLGVPVAVARSPATFSWHPRIAVASDKIYLLWQEIIFSGGSHGGDILFAVSGDGGASFSQPLNLSRSRGGDGKGRLDRNTWSNGSHDLAVTSDGTLVASWTEYDGALWLARSRDGGASFSQAARVAGDMRRPARAPRLAAGPGRTVYLAWTVGEDPAADIHVAESSDGGESFGAPQRVGAGPGHADAPSLAVDGAGAVHLVYAERLAGRAGAYAVRYARSPGGAGRFGAPRTISAPVGPSDGSAAYPRIALATGAGPDRLVVVWEVFAAGAGRPRALGMSYSPDGGAGFSAPVRVPGSDTPLGGSNGSHQGLLGQKLAAGPGGQLAIVSSSLLPGKRSRVWLIEGRIAHVKDAANDAGKTNRINAAGRQP